MIKKINCLIVTLAMTAFLAADSSSETLEVRLSERVARLYLNVKSLNTVYGDLHTAALDAADDEHRLGHIQKTYLLVNEANLIGLCQWKLLSVIDYIKPDYRSDYFTLRVRDLDRAAFESRDRVNSLKLYYAYVADNRVKKLLDEAIGLMEANIYTFEDIRDLLRPLANPPGVLDHQPPDS